MLITMVCVTSNIFQIKFIGDTFFNDLMNTLIETFTRDFRPIHKGWWLTTVVRFNDNVFEYYL